ncbi:MAG: DHH family phosphoesterase [Negativicutes bacterium]|nr:DHH family phosphoesterase [Negativicutes bacterium]
MKSVVLSYTNPDLDGVASAIAIEALYDLHWEARVSGSIDHETAHVLKSLGLPLPPQVESWEQIHEIWLIDTHHRIQLPTALPLSRVVKITDHHPGGNPNCFPHAELQNETVGAVGTLIVERYEAMRKAILPEVALLLQAAILSNSLEFRSGSTSDRDRHAYEKLSAIKPIGQILIEGMRECRRGIVNLCTDQLVQSDTKLLETAYGVVAIAQVEAPGASKILTRSDLMVSLRMLASRAEAASAILNIVDTASGTSGVVVTDPEIALLLAEKLSATVGNDQVIRVNRVLQRKSDIIPFILKKW